MSLQSLVKFKTELKDTLTELSLEQAIGEKFKLIEIIKNRHNIPAYDSDIEQHVNAYNELLAKNNDIIQLIEQTISKIDQDINQLGADISGTEEYRARFTETNMTSYLPSTELAEQTILSRISSYSGWKYPGLQLHCRYFNNGIDDVDSRKYAHAKSRINNMVSSDPLYLAGTNESLIKDMITVYSDIYQSRLRLYEVHDGNLSILPQQQFSFVLCWDFLNYLPLDKIDVYLNGILRLLRPGGVAMFSYNNCELARSAQMVDENEACWATETIIKKLVTDLGFEIITFRDIELKDDRSMWVSWAEIRRPGELTTVKLAQAKGLIGQK